MSINVYYAHFGAFLHMLVKQKLKGVAKFVAGLSVLAPLLALETWLFITFYQWVEQHMCSIDFQSSGHCYAPWFETFELIYFPLLFSTLLLSALLGFVVITVWLGLRLRYALMLTLSIIVSGYGYVFVISHGVLWVSLLVSLVVVFGCAFLVWKKYGDLIS